MRKSLLNVWGTRDEKWLVCHFDTFETRMGTLFKTHRLAHAMDESCLQIFFWFEHRWLNSSWEVFPLQWLWELHLSHLPRDPHWHRLVCLHTQRYHNVTLSTRNTFTKHPYVDALEIKHIVLMRKPRWAILGHQCLLTLGQFSTFFQLVTVARYCLLNQDIGLSRSVQFLYLY